MSESGGHGWGFCEAETQMPDILFQRIVNCYISTVYYAGVAMVGKRFQKETELISVDAWKTAFSENDILDAFRFFFCDALPEQYEQLVKDEIRKHPLNGVAPATIPLSTATARIQWAAFAAKFLELETEVEEWATVHLDKLPNMLPNFDTDNLNRWGNDGEENESEDESNENENKD